MSLMHRIPGKKIFVPKNKEKFKGKYCVIRSSYEEIFARWCDKTDNVVEWSSEEIFIEYYDPITKKVRRYYPDFFITIIDKNNKLRKYLIEIKEKRETLRPNNKKNYLIYERNMAKWRAAQKFCAKYGLEFKIITESHLDI